MQTRRWTAWFLVFALVAVLTPGVVLAQETESEPYDLGPFATVVSMIWDQLGLGANISPDGATTKGPSNDMGPGISPDGATTEGPSNDMGPGISPDG